MFSVSTKAQYGIRALVHLARNEGEGGVAFHSEDADGETAVAEPIVTASVIAKAENISQKYLEGILAQLTATGLLVSERGKRGGYRLARSAAEITMLEIVEALEGEIRPVGCVDRQDACSYGQACLPRRFWIGLKDSIDGYLSSRTLRDILDA